MRYFSYGITIALLALSGMLRSYPFAYAAILGLTITIGKEVFDRYIETKTFKNTIPDDAKRKITDLEARITSVELGIQRRGF